MAGIKNRTPKEIKEGIIQYLFDYKDWYIDNLLREHAEEILKNNCYID